MRPAFAAGVGVENLVAELHRVLERLEVETAKISADDREGRWYPKAAALQLVEIANAMAATATRCL